MKFISFVIIDKSLLYYRLTWLTCISNANVQSGVENLILFSQKQYLFVIIAHQQKTESTLTLTLTAITRQSMGNQQLSSISTCISNPSTFLQCHIPFSPSQCDLTLQLYLSSSLLHFFPLLPEVAYYKTYSLIRYFNIRNISAFPQPLGQQKEKKTLSPLVLAQHIMPCTTCSQLWLFQYIPSAPIETDFTH